MILSLRVSAFALPLVILASSAAVVVACSSTEVAGADSGTTPTSDSGGPMTDGGAADSGDAEAIETDHQGNIFAVSESVTSPTAAANYRAGAFFAIGAKPSDEVIATTTIGACIAQTLKPGSGSDGKDVSAGKLTITGGSSAIAISPKSDGTYPPSTSNSLALWKGGEQLTATVEGAADGVPAFQTVLTAPSLLKFSAPALAQGAGPDSSLNVVRSGALALAWTGTSSGSLVAYFSSTTATEAHTLSCRFSPAAGTAQIPKEALATLTPGAGFFDIYVEEKARPAVKAWSVSFTVSTNTNSATGANMTGTANIQ